MTEELKTHYEVVISFKAFIGRVPQKILKEKAQKLADDMGAELREVAE